jgi:3-oxosteroid 1-dehydrogenase
MSGAETFDGRRRSGAAGAMAALRAAELGLSVIIEKAHNVAALATSGGGQVPNRQLAPNDDVAKNARMHAVAQWAHSARPAGCVFDNAPTMARFEVAHSPSWPPGRTTTRMHPARVDRSLICDTDGRQLGEHSLMREQYNRFKVLSRYSMDVMSSFISTRPRAGSPPLKMFFRY